MSAAPAQAASKIPVLDQRPEVPLAFLPNAGQWPEDVRFALGSERFGVTLKDDAILFHYADVEAQPEALSGRGRRRIPRYRTGAVEMKLVDGALQSPVGLDERPGTVLDAGAEGSELSLGRYGRVVYQGVYPGIDLVFRAHGGLVEYDFEVAPDADASRIELAFEGGAEARIESDGSLLIPTASGGHFRHGAPSLDQDDGRAGRAKVKGGWRSRGRGRLGFEIGPHDRRRGLRIDPTVVYTASGGSSFQDRSSGIARDATGNVYLAYQRFGTGGTTPRAWIAKFDPSGTFVTETSFGGTCIGISSVAVDAAGDIYVAGGACGPIPLVNAYQSTLPPLAVLSEVALVARLRPDLSVAYSTYFGGTQPGLGLSYVDDYALDVAAGSNGRVAISGWSWSAGLPAVNGFQISNTSYLAAFVAVFDTTASGASSLLYSTYLGSALGYAEGKSVAVDPGGNVYVTGYDAAPLGEHFPTKNAFQDVPPAGQQSYMDDAFLAKIDPAKAGAESLVYSTLFGGTGSESGTALAVDGAGNAYVAGFTRSNNLPTTPGVYRPDNPDATKSQVFVAKLDTTAIGAASRRWATYIGPGQANGVAIDSAGRSFVVGQSTSPAFPITSDAIPPNTGYPYIFALDPSASALAYSTRLAGALGYPNDNDASGVVYDDATFTAYVAGHTFGTTGSDLFVIGVRHPFEDARIEILPTTTRWRPRQDTTGTVDLIFSGPGELETVELFVTGPPNVPEGQVALPADYRPTLEAPFDPQSPARDANGNYKLVWSGPWTIDDAASGRKVPLPRGDYTLALRGTQRPRPGELIESAPYDRVSLVEVTSISVRGRSHLGDPRHPGSSAIFAEATDAGPLAEVLDMVEVEATVEPLVEGEEIAVRFKAFDVADGTPEGTPVACAQVPGFDNCGDPKSGTFVESDGASPVDGATGVSRSIAGGKATAFFRVSSRQGDNYRVGASTSQEWLAGVTVLLPSPAGEHGAVRDAAGQAPAQGKQMTAVLTVWRTLHLEVDRLFSATPQAHQDAMDAGVGRSFSQLGPTTLVDSSEPLGPFVDVDHLVPDDWRGADLTLGFHPEHVYYVAHSDHETASVRLDGMPTLLNGFPDISQIPDRSYRLSDDLVSALDQPLDTSLAEEILAQAYIRVLPVAQPLDDARIPFDIDPLSSTYNRYASDDGLPPLPSQVFSLTDYWSTSLVGAFDSHPRKDLDPQQGEEIRDPETHEVYRAFWLATTRVRRGVNKPTSAMFLETVRDIFVHREDPSGPLPDLSPELSRRVVAHEMLHAFGVKHDGNETEGALMCSSLTVDTPIGGQITPAQLKTIRATGFPDMGEEEGPATCFPN